MHPLEIRGTPKKGYAMKSNVEAVIAIPTTQRSPGLRIGQLHGAILGAPSTPF